MTQTFIARSRFLLLALMLCSPSVSHSAQPPQGDGPSLNPLLLDMQLANLPTYAEKANLLSAALAKAREKPQPDVRLVFDLTLEMADLQEAAGQWKEAIQFLVLATSQAEEHRDQLNENVAVLLARIGDLHKRNGKLRLAERAYQAELQERLDGGQTGQAIAAVFAKLAEVADLRKNARQAEDYRGKAAKALKPGDAAQSKQKSGGNRSTDTGGYREVEVYYATDRAQTGSGAADDFYGYERGKLDYGTVTVSIPDVHVAGAVEAPSIWRLEFNADPSKHVMVQKVEPKEAAAFFSQMQGEFSHKGKKEAFIFVHGYNVTFDGAAKRAAQLAYDMKYAGVPVLYSWPSAGKTTRYIGDTAVVRLSGRRLAGFLADMREKSGATTIHIVAHSMGNRALTDALEILALKGQAKPETLPMFGQVFFAAPDVDADLFAAMAKTFRPVAKRLTLYTSEEDWALKTSRELHGSAMRAGLGGDHQITSDDFDTIDMTGLGQDMLSHSYFADDSSAIADMASLIWHDAGPAVRCGLVQSASASGIRPFWKYEAKASCSNRTFLALLAYLRQMDNPSAAEVRAFLKDKLPDPALRRQVEEALLTMLK